MLFFSDADKNPGADVSFMQQEAEKMAYSGVNRQQISRDCFNIFSKAAD
jgi:hypothetical protein